MLALNTAIEAVRAGPQRRNFGVVTGEIHKLADESDRSVVKIDDLDTSF